MVSSPARFFNQLTRLGRVPRLASRAHAELFRFSRGRLIGRWFGAPVLVLETVGRRSGKPRSTPIIYMPDGDRYVVSPANAGANATPAWWLNLREAGHGVAVIGDRRERVLPRVATGDEREQLWRRFADFFPALDRYRDFSDRELPIVVLEPAAPKDYPPGD